MAESRTSPPEVAWTPQRVAAIGFFVLVPCVLVAGAVVGWVMVLAGHQHGMVPANVGVILLVQFTLSAVVHRRLRRGASVPEWLANYVRRQAGEGEPGRYWWVSAAVLIVVMVVITTVSILLAK